MKTSEAIDQIATALAKAQAEMKNAAFNRTNPHFKSKYADLGGIRDTITPSLTAHGISVVQTTEMTPAGLMLHTRMMHTSGQWIEGEYPIMADLEKPQAVGSALTYARRYTLSAIGNIASEEDDDANAAQEQAGAKTGRSERFIYEGLANSLKSIKTEPGLAEWKEKNHDAIQALSDTYFNHIQTAYKDHRSTIVKPGAEAPARPKNGKLSEQALDANKPPMPDDGLPAGF